MDKLNGCVFLLKMMTYQKNKKLFDSNPAYNESFLKTKIKSHGHEVTDFYYKEIPKMDSNHTSSAVISLDYALIKDGNYYLQKFICNQNWR